MRVAVVNANTVWPPVVPLGMLLIAGAARRSGHTVIVVDLCVMRETALEEPLEVAFQDGHLDAVCVALRNLDSANPEAPGSTISDLQRIIAACRDRSDAPIILGGSGLSIAPKEMVAAVNADLGICGEGEEVLPLLLDRLAAGQPVSGLPGVVERLGNDTTASSQPQRITEPARFVRPALDLIDLQAYLRLGGSGSVQSKRGCRFSCAYCTYPGLEGDHIRCASVDWVVGEVERLAAAGAKHFWFVDSVFTVPEGHAVSICKELCRRGLPEHIMWSAYATPLGFTAELAERMRRAGCVELIFGTDAACTQSLRGLRKPFRPSHVASATQYAKGAGLDFAHHLLFGGPGETVETVKETLEFMAALDCRLGLDAGIRIYPKTPIERTARKEGIIGPETDLLEPHFYVSRYVESVLDGILLSFCRSVPRTRFFGRDGRPHPYTDPRLVEVYRRGFVGPYWAVIDEYERITGACSTSDPLSRPISDSVPETGRVAAAAAY